MFEFSPIIESIELVFPCPRCGNTIHSDAIPVPVPNFEAENHTDSISSELEKIECDHCGEEVSLSLYCGFGRGEGQIEGVDDDSIEVVENYAEDDFIDPWIYTEIQSDAEKLLEAADGLSVEVRPLMYRLLYANVITLMEAFLHTTLKNAVLKDECCMRNFVESYKPYQNVKFSLSDFYKKKDGMTKMITDTLNGILYHDMPKVKAIYLAVLGVDLGDISMLCKAVQIRHDIIHRNGKGKDGSFLQIGKKDVSALHVAVKELRSNVEMALL